MPIDAAEIQRLERALADARAQLEREKGKMYDIVRKAMTDEEWGEITSRVTDRKDRILLGLEAPEPVRRAGGARSGRTGDLTCDICGETNFSPRGLALHKTRLHKGESEPRFAEQVGKGEELGGVEAESGGRRR